MIQCYIFSCSTPPTSTIITNNTTSTLPLVTWHGFNDDADSCTGLIDTVVGVVPGLYVRNVMVGDTMEEDKFNSVFMQMNEQVSYVCDLLSADPHLSHGYNGIGLSQGGLLLRGLVEMCPHPPMRTLVTLGTPHQGIYGLPKCSSAKDLFCQLVRQLLSLGTYGAYLPWVQDRITTAQYWHDPLNSDEYEEGSHFLAVINNARLEKQKEFKENLAGLDNFVMIAWKNDTFIKPRKSSHFEFYEPGQDKTISPLRESLLYQDNWIGLKDLDEKGNLHFLEMEGDHMDLDYQWFYKNVVERFLIK